MSKKPPVVFIAGERQHAGKTVTSLGVISALSKHFAPEDIGYFKPVGQEMTTLPNGQKIDKDVRIVKEFTGLDMPDMGILSPVRVVSGVTRDYISGTNQAEITAKFEKNIRDTMESLADKKIIIAEGTGHPGVGSVVGLSNARVANMIDAKILYLVGGGIGRTIDELEVDFSYFSHHKSKVAGVLFNKVLPKKLDQMKEVITEKALNRIFPEWSPKLSVFGHMPIVKYLNNPSMQLISKSFKNHRAIKGGKCAGAWHRACRKVKIISLDFENFSPVHALRPRDIAVLGAASHRRLKKVIDWNNAQPAEKKLGGLILTCSSDKRPDAAAEALVAESCLPTIAVMQDTAETDAMLYKCFNDTKIQLYDKMKHQKIVNLFEEHFDTEKFLRAFGI
ncbi:AAA family ATPase [Pontiella agarivorans]|uniref:AAA family ATPase n=1 Tax=Pontiella agarivorans TaxID=3038953 RepID=A0ABU5MVM6_9BACT|nr:AAA family ATPase [Pontiella agarivorans]MDZ8118168.1 AAA family ATPase [Pontiella agarivorans]